MTRTRSQDERRSLADEPCSQESASIPVMRPFTTYRRPHSASTTASTSAVTISRHSGNSDIALSLWNGRAGDHDTTRDQKESERFLRVGEGLLRQSTTAPLDSPTASP